MRIYSGTEEVMDSEENAKKIFWIGIQGYSNWKKLSDYIEKKVNLEPGSLIMKEDGEI